MKRLHLSVFVAALLILGVASGVWRPDSYELGSGFEAKSFSNAFEGGR